MNDDDASPIFLAVPARDRGGVPRINDQLTIPGVLPTHVPRIPSASVIDEAPQAAWASAPA